jgi:hypothetical protein
MLNIQFGAWAVGTGAITCCDNGSHQIDTAPAQQHWSEALKIWTSDLDPGPESTNSEVNSVAAPPITKKMRFIAARFRKANFDFIFKFYKFKKKKIKR